MNISMREIFGKTLAEIGKTNKQLVVLDADCSVSTKTSFFGAEFPERFFNFGIAEANMVSAAAGFSVSGFVPVVSTFAFLLSLRAGDQVRSQIAHSRLNVKLAGGYSGLSDFADGSSHQSVADIAVMRALPNMTVIAPGDIIETREALKTAIEYKGPVYLRLSRNEVEEILPSDYNFKIGKAVIVREGGDVSIFTTGTMLKQGVEAAIGLGKKGISAELVHFPTIKPIDEAALEKSLRKTGAAVTIEEHNIIGGFGSAVAEQVVKGGTFPVEMIGLCDCFGESGDLKGLYEKHGLTAKKICEAAEKVIKKKLSGH